SLRVQLAFLPRNDPRREPLYRNLIWCYHRAFALIYRRIEAQRAARLTHSAGGKVHFRARRAAMRIARTSNDVAWQVLRVLKRHSITRGVRWEDGSPLDVRIWISVNGAIDPTQTEAIQRDIEAIAGATVQE